MLPFCFASPVAAELLKLWFRFRAGSMAQAGRASGA